MIKVLVTAAGSTAGINCINALKNQTEIEMEIIASDASNYAAGLYLADQHYPAQPFFPEQGYIRSLLEICEKESIDVILPTFSLEIPIIAGFVDEFRSRGVNLCLASSASIKLFGNKWDTYSFFKDLAIGTPDTWLLSAIAEFHSPLYIKPILGSGSDKNHMVFSQASLSSLKAKLDQNEYIAQPLISAREFTVDGLADNESKLVGMIPRERIITRDGLAVVTRTVDEPQITEMIKKIVSFGKLHGPFAIQYFKTLENRFLFIDVNTRFAAGGLPLSVQAGVNIPLETVKLALGKKVSINHEYKKNLTMIRYYTELFLE